MKKSINKINIFVVLLLMTVSLIFLKTGNEPIDKSEVTIADIIKTKQNKTSKEILIEELFGEELMSIMQLSNKNYIDSYLKNREKKLPKIKKMTIRELLHSVKILSHPMYYKKGDIYSEEILRRGESAMPKLTKLILDDQNISHVSYADLHYYLIGDVAVRFIHEINIGKMILHNFLWDEFRLEGTFLPDLAASNYGKKIIFKINDNDDRKKNRKLLYEYIKKKKYNHPNNKYRKSTNEL